jgi:hypothetical protein
MDLLRSLIVPPAYSNAQTDTASRDPRLSRCTTAPSGQSTPERSPLASLTGPAAHQPAQQEPASAPTKRKKKKKQKQKEKQTQTSPKQTNIAAVTVLPTPAAITKTKKRKQSHLFHPDRPKSAANKRPHISYEDLYDDIPDQPPTQPAQPNSESQDSNSNPEATQTCFFWYHGSCKRSLDRNGCQLRHALLDPPEKVVAPPRFVHPKPCELQWCAGDGPTHKGQRAKNEAEQKRYFEVGVSDDGSAGKDADQGSGDVCFLSGFEEPDGA